MTEENNSHVRYLDQKILKELAHRMACELFQDEEPMGLFEDHDEAKLDSSLALPRQFVFGRELYSSIYAKAAVLFYALNRNHPFSNGNKRLSAAAFVTFLFINERVLRVTTQELRDKALEVAQTAEPIDNVVASLAKWAEENTFSLEEFKKEIIKGK